MMVGKWILVLILIVGATLRLASASLAPLEAIERDELIPTAMTITKEHLPLRAAQHGILPAYIIRASGLAFGNSILGLRLTSVIAGVATILLLYVVGARWWGQSAGLIAASLAAEATTLTSRREQLSFPLIFSSLRSRFTHSRVSFTRSIRGAHLQKLAAGYMVLQPPVRSDFCARS